MIFTTFAAPPARAQDQEKKAEKKGAEDAKRDEAQKTEAEKKQQEDASKQQATEAKPAAEARRQEEPRKPEPMSAPTFAGLRLRSIGPAFTSGRVVGFAVEPKDHSHYFVATASGGVWKTENGGTTFRSVFDGEGSYSIGWIVLDQKNPLNVWVGAGENNSQRSVSYGDGVYKSEDGGKTWRNVGLKKSEHIGRIAIDPRDSNVVYVAAQGPLWGPGGDRGLYKTTDGGKTWKNVLSISENTGVTDVVIDPDSPDTILAAAYQRRRHYWTLIDGGPEGGIYKSTDAGATWKRVRAGLPANVDVGRIGLYISPADTNVVYAVVEAADNRGGIYRSSDRGESWERRNPYDVTAMYYARIVADPKDVDRIYVMNVLIQVSDDGGRTLRPLGERSKHVDNHDIWIDPDNTNHYLVGCDGGVYESWDRAASWNFKSNLPVTQLYDVTTDNATPFYNVFGGAQDNFNFGGPSRTRNANGIVNADWFVTLGGDGFRTQVDPTDPNTIYTEYQNGALSRFDKRTGERMGIQPEIGKGEEPLRWNWDSPFIISPHLHTRLYFAADRLFRSDDRGDSWRVVSGQLSRGLNRDILPVMGRVWSVDAVARHASTAFYGNASALSESPKKEGLIYVGTDDGLVNVTEDGGRNWRRIDTFPGIPEHAYVSRLFASNHDENTVYAAFDNHQNADFKPYLLKSTDAGRTWTSIASNLPENGPVLAVNEDHVNPNLLFAGTEYGLWFSLDGGAKWVQLKGGMPTIAVHDIAIQRRENDLVVGTFGRGIYILDNYTPLRLLKPEMLAQDSILFPVKNTLMYIQAQPIGGNGKSFQGESYFNAENPPYGATFTYYLKEAIRTRRQIRQESERAAERRQQPPAPVTAEQLRAEEEEEAPAMVFTITDSSGNIVRRITGPVGAGFSRVNWDLRYAPPIVTAPPPGGGGEEGGGGGGGGGGQFGGGPSGPLVLPGTYKVSMAKRAGGVMTSVGTPQTFEVTVEEREGMTQADRDARVAFQQKVTRLQRAVTGALNTGEALRPRLAAIKRALLNTPDPGNKMINEATRLDDRAGEIMRQLRGDTVLQRHNENTPPSISDRVFSIIGDESATLSRPTRTQEEQYRVAAQEFEGVLAQLRQLVDVDLRNLEKQMEAAGAPWTPGRLPDWRDQ
ncbi:MAG: glycosyl hydrolase [Acidobacteria bacterium]|nr:glycosyl hydrolase [Acidobacteriota bacterium]